MCLPVQVDPVIKVLGHTRQVDQKVKEGPAWSDCTASMVQDPYKGLEFALLTG